MSFMIVPEPLFNKDMAVQAYRLRTFDCDKLMGIQDDFRKMDEAFSNPGLNMVEQIGIAPLTGGKKLFAEISHVQLMTGIPKNLKIRPEQLVCVLPHDAFHEQSTVSALVPLREMGYRKFPLYRFSACYVSVLTKRSLRICSGTMVIVCPFHRHKLHPRSFYSSGLYSNMSPG